MKKLLSILSVASISASASVSSVSCTSPYRYWGAFNSDIKEGKTFIVCYHVKNEEKYTKLQSDLEFESTHSDQKVNAFKYNLKQSVNKYNAQVNDFNIDDSPEYTAFGYGKKINNDLSNMVDWSVSKASEMWQEWWSKNVWNWLTSSLVGVYYKNMFVEHNAAQSNTFNLSEKSVDKYISASLGNTNTSPVLMLIRNGRFLGFLNYDKDIKVETQENRVNDLCDQVDKLLTDSDAITSFLINVNNTKS